MRPKTKKTPAALAERKQRFELYFQQNKMMTAEILAEFEDRQRSKKPTQIDQPDLFK